MKGVVAGLALAGGKSSRMGHDKALIRLPGEGGETGPTMLARAYGLLSELTPRVWVSCAAGRPYAGYPCLFDEGAEAGPGAGILSGLRAAEAAGCTALLCLPCDLPFMDAPTLRRLLAARDAAPPHTLAILYSSAESGLLEPLVAIYECAALPFFMDTVASGRRSLFDIIPPERQCRLPYGRDETRPFFNMNSAEDLRAASHQADARPEAFPKPMTDAFLFPTAPDADPADARRFHIVLVEPEIPPNTGAIARLCGATDAVLHLVHPLGFRTDDRHLKRAGLDYWEAVRIRHWPDFASFLAAQPGERLHLFTTKSARPYTEARFALGDFLVFGRETKGLPEATLALYSDRCLTIPMRNARIRSLNLAMCAGIALYEAIRQNPQQTEQQSR